MYAAGYSFNLHVLLDAAQIVTLFLHGRNIGWCYTDCLCRDNLLDGGVFKSKFLKPLDLVSGDSECLHGNHFIDFHVSEASRFYIFYIVSRNP